MPAYSAPEHFCQNVSTLPLEDLKTVDIWALGMLLFVIINPDLKYPYQIELEKVQNGHCLSVLERLISKSEKPVQLGLLVHATCSKLTPMTIVCVSIRKTGQM